MDRHGVKGCVEAGLRAGGSFSVEPLGTSGADNSENLGGSVKVVVEAGVGAGVVEGSVGAEADVGEMVKRGRNY